MLIDRDALEPLFDEAVKKAATDLIRAELNSMTIRTAVEKAVRRISKVQEMEDQIFSTLDHLITVTVRRALDDSGIENQIRTIATEYMVTPEYQQRLKELVIKGMDEAIIRVKIGNAD